MLSGWEWGAHWVNGMAAQQGMTPVDGFFEPIWLWSYWCVVLLLLLLLLSGAGWWLLLPDGQVLHGLADRAKKKQQ